jgi:hypothetical protein
VPKSTTLIPPQRLPQQRTSCPAWCVNHDPGEGYCVADNTPIPGPAHHAHTPYVGLSSHPDHGPVIDLYRSADHPLTLDDAEQIAHTLLAKVAAGRSLAVTA